MIAGKRLTLCLPCRNEGNHLREVVASVPDDVDEIIVISNNSADDTVKVAMSIGGRVRLIEDNRTMKGIGYGYAHISGIREAEGDIVVGADSDGTYPLHDIAGVVGHLLDNDLDFISCNRYPIKEGTEISPRLQLGVHLLNSEVRVLYGTKIHDILSGMWVFRKSISDQLRLTMGDWNLSPQIKINAATNPSIRFSEYSIVQHQRFGKTSQHYFKTGFSHALWILRNRFREAGRLPEPANITTSRACRTTSLC